MEAGGWLNGRDHRWSRSGLLHLRRHSPDFGGGCCHRNRAARNRTGFKFPPASLFGAVPTFLGSEFEPPEKMKSPRYQGLDSSFQAAQSLNLVNQYIQNISHPQIFRSKFRENSRSTLRRLLKSDCGFSLSFPR